MCRLSHRSLKVGELFSAQEKQQFIRMCGCSTIVKLVVFLALVFVRGPRMRQLIVAAVLGYYFSKRSTA